MADTYYSDVAQAKLDAKSNSAKQVTDFSQVRKAKGVLTLSGDTVQNDIHIIDLLPKGANVDWLSASILSSNAALATKIGTVNSAGTFTAKATLTAASNVGRASAPENVDYTPTTEELWIAVQLTAASPATSGTAKVVVDYIHGSH